MKKKIGEAVAGKLTDVLLSELQRKSGLPVKNGLSYSVNPFTQEVFVGFRKRF